MDKENFDSIYERKLDSLFRRLPMFSRVGAAAYKPGLERVIKLSKAFGDPHKRFKAIHIAGTNGKGSVANMTAAMLQAQGYRTALYTSPHLVDFRERMRINGEMIPREKVVEFLDRCDRMEFDDAPSFFELTMMMAFDWFAAEKVDYAVIEVGMGGRLDSTNIISPLLSVITNISFDHTQFLGDTLAAIAGEKAGIMKPGVPVVIGEAEGDVEKVFEQKSAATGSPLTKAYAVSLLESCLPSGYGHLECRSPLLGKFRSPLAGDYQKRNINTVLHTLKKMREVGIEISDDNARRGLENVDRLTGFEGRWQVISESPVTVCDTGHNIGGMEYNLRQIHRILEDKRAKGGNPTLRMVIGFVADKDVDHILPLFPKDAVYYITNADIPRAMKAETLCSKFRDAGFVCRTVATPAEAYREALNDAGGADDVIYIGGSTFIVADFLKQTGR